MAKKVMRPPRWFQQQQQQPPRRPAYARGCVKAWNLVPASLAEQQPNAAADDDASAPDEAYTEDELDQFGQMLQKRKPVINLPSPDEMGGGPEIRINGKPVRSRERTRDSLHFIRQQFLRWGELVVEKSPEISNVFSCWKDEARLRAIAKVLDRIIEEHFSE